MAPNEWAPKAGGTVGLRHRLQTTAETNFSNRLKKVTAVGQAEAPTSQALPITVQATGDLLLDHADGKRANRIDLNDCAFRPGPREMHGVRRQAIERPGCQHLPLRLISRLVVPDPE